MQNSNPGDGAAHPSGRDLPAITVDRAGECAWTRVEAITGEGEEGMAAEASLEWNGTGSCAEAARLLQDRFGPETAEQLLGPEVQEGPRARLLEALGTAYFLTEHYDKACDYLARAVELEPGEREWQQKLALARANLLAHANVDPGPALDFTRGDLLSDPRPRVIEAPPPEPVSLPERLLDTARARLNRALGAGTAALFGVVERWAKPGAPTGVWTTWYRKNTVGALLELSAIRKRLDTRNLVDTYPLAELSGFLSRGLVRPAGVERFRTADGSWNNLDNPKEGAAGVRIPRNVLRSATWPHASALLEPNPAEISLELFSRGPRGIQTVPFLNLLAAAWIQFMFHDWVSHRTEASDRTLGMYAIELPPEHPARRLYHQTHLRIPVSTPDPTRMPADAGSPPTYASEVTSWWDGSQIYGSDQATADRLRSFRNGKLRLQANGRLPIGANGLEEVGYGRNWWLGLALLHTLFVREHNAICDRLAARHPEFSDAQLYGVARLINTAVMAKIHSVEWTPAILPNPVLNLALNGNWHGLIETLLHRRGKRKVLRRIKIRDSLLGGLVGNPRERFGVPYGLSEEFTEVYRLHDLLPDELALRSIGGDRACDVPLPAARLASSYALSTDWPLADLLFSFGNQQPGQLVLNNYPRSLQQVAVAGNPLYDLAAVDILRARERGVPRYNEFRRQLGLEPIRDFDDLTSDPAQLATLRRIYRNDIEAIDLLVGTRAETERPTGFGFGETMFQIFILNASRRLQADRFFTDCYTEEYYTREGLDWIDAASFKSVLLRHYPELGVTGLGNVNNAFEPWDTGTLDPARHPLEAFA